PASFKFDKPPRAQPPPAAIELFDSIFDVVSALAGRIERLGHLLPHALEIVGMKLGFDSILVVKESLFGQTIKALRIFVIQTDVVSQRVTPGSHLRRRHHEIEELLLALEQLLEVWRIGRNFNAPAPLVGASLQRGLEEQGQLTAVYRCIRPYHGNPS